MVTDALTGDVSYDDEVYFYRPEVGVVTWDPRSKTVYVEWQGWADSTEVEGLLEAGLRALTDNLGSRCLADCRNLTAVKQSDQDWIDRVWFPRALAAGLRHVAVVIPKSGLARMNAYDILSGAPATKLQVEYFGTVELATEWLSNPPVRIA